MDNSFCRVCNVALNGPAPARQHYDSEKHKKKAAAAGGTLSHGALQPSAFHERISSLASGFTTTSISRLPERECDSHTCYLCNVALTSPQHRDQHMSGKAHAKKKKEWEEQRLSQDRGMVLNAASNIHNNMIGTSIGMSKFICEICNRPLDTLEQLQRHKESPRCRKMATYGGNSVTPQTSRSYDPSLTFIRCDKCGKSVNTTEQLRIHQDSPKCRKAAGAGSSLASSADRTIWHECRVCQKTLNSIEQLEIHMKSHGQQSPVVSDTLARNLPSDGMWTSSQPSSARNNWAAGQSELSDFWKNRLPQPIGSNRPNPNAMAPQKGYAHDLDQGIPSFLGPPSSSTSMPNDRSFQNSAPGPDHTVPKSLFPAQMPSLTEQYNSAVSTPHIMSLDLREDCPVSYNKGSAVPTVAGCQIQPAAHVADDQGMMNQRGGISRSGNLYQPSAAAPELPRAPMPNASIHSNPTPQAVDDMAAALGELSIKSEPVLSDKLMKLLEDGEPTTDTCDIAKCIWHCYVCKTHVTGTFNKTQHLSGQQHKKKWEKYKAEQHSKPVENAEPNPFKHFQYFCRICMVPFNSKSSELSHNQGKQHLTALAKSQTAPDRSMSLLNKQLDVEECEEQGYCLTADVPRSYQLDLYEQAMQDNTVVFLPTGTGKTLVAGLVISQMLMLNPHYQVVFLVDKVLLVVQQAEVLRRQIGEMMYRRFCAVDGSSEQRKPRIASLCGEVQDTAGLPIWQMDVLVVTAAYYNNLLDSHLLRWNDNSLVVIDEAHHCFKEHPFHVLLRNFHIKQPMYKRPKILGLTASPAGLDAVSSTERSLEQLLHNIGGVKLITVEDSSARDELTKYTSNTHLTIKVVQLSAREQDLYALLLRHMKYCYGWMEENSNITDLCQVKDSWVLNDEEEDFNDTDTEATDVVNTLLGVLKHNKLEPIRHSLKPQVEAMRWHLEAMGYAFVQMNEIGLQCAHNQLQPLTTEQNPGRFSHMAELIASRAALNDMKAIEEFTLEYASNQQLREKLAAKNPNDPTFMPAIQQLIEEIETQMNWERQEEKPIVLVLVQQRETAKLMADILRNSPSIQRTGLAVTPLVGHGKTTSMGLGMSVRTQENVLRDIKQHKFQIVVATSIAEEGVDFPECELVIQMDPPSSVKALVQIRGRARKKGSRFIALCRTEGQKSALENLMAHEKHMIDAVHRIIQKQRGNNSSSSLMSSQ